MTSIRYCDKVAIVNGVEGNKYLEALCPEKSGFRSNIDITGSGCILTMDSYLTCFYIQISGPGIIHSLYKQFSGFCFA